MEYYIILNNSLGMYNNLLESGCHSFEQIITQSVKLGLSNQ